MAPRPRVRHEMKCWPEFFQPTLNAHKRFELRRDDRPEGFQVGDELLLKEWNPAIADTHFSHTSNREEAIERAYTGREVLVRVDYIMPGVVVNELMGRRLGDGDYVIMSISRVH